MMRAVAKTILVLVNISHFLFGQSIEFRLLRRRSAKGAFYSGASPPTVQRVRWPTEGERIAESPGHQAPPRSSSRFFTHREDGQLKEAGEFPDDSS
jgi:hypothetical protein